MTCVRFKIILQWRVFAGNGGFWRVLLRPNSPKLDVACTELIFSAWAAGVRKLLQSKHQLSPRDREIGRA